MREHASKWFLQHMVSYNALFNCFHCSAEDSTGSGRGQVHLSGYYKWGEKKKKKSSYFKHPIVQEKQKPGKQQEHKQMRQAE